MPSTMRSPGTPPHLPRVPGVVFVLARTGANCPCRGFPAVVFAGVAFEVPRVRSVARAGGFAETPYYTTARSRSVSKPELRILRGGGYWELLEELIAELVGVQQEDPQLYQEIRGLLRRAEVGTLRWRRDVMFPMKER